MNNMLELKGKFEQAKRIGGGGKPKLSKGKSVNYNDVIRLTNNLKQIKIFWENQKILSQVLVNVHYNKIVAKSNRIKTLFTIGKKTSDNSIVGAKFSNDNSPKHIITHYISHDILNNAIEQLTTISSIMKRNSINIIDCDNFDKIDIKQSLKQSLVDISFIEKFSIPQEESNVVYKNEAIVSIYKTDGNAKDMLEKIGIDDIMPSRMLDDITILLTPEQFNKLRNKAPFLIAMSVSDISELSLDNFDFNQNLSITIPKPTNEPTIGVIDTLFDKNVYFSEWVEYKDCIDKNIPREKIDYRHGTEVSSIIVDGPSFNKNLDDGCGRFRVRHFGVAKAKQFSSFSILRSIKKIIEENRDIKVWNLSLGSKLEITKNSISPEAAILDKIQYIYDDIIFIISGTNKTSDSNAKIIGSPADSINSLVVNSVTLNNKPASYTRTGPVLSFFVKPDISYYGGDKNEPIITCSPNGESFVMGTSFAAPWIARKMAYLMHVLGLSREVAKALIIHSATSWEKTNNDTALSMGYGVVPIRIEDIINSKNDEIKFIISGVSEKYDTYAYNIPVPKDKEKHPFIAKATLCYFPACSRNQGVDYTNTELDIHFGQIDQNKNRINSINSNFQNDEEFQFYEKDARLMFRKWDNVKHISDVLKKVNRGKKAYTKEGFWGISLKTTERLDEKYGNNLKFGVVITLKEINGINRIDSFIKACSFCGWLVNRIDVKNKIDVYNAAQEEVTFDEDMNE